MKNKNLEKPERNKAGVYQFIDSKDNIIYIGSSKNLYERIRSYTTTKNKLKESLINKYTAKINYIYCEDFKEQEKFLIEQLQPKYNKKEKEIKFYLKRDFKYIDNRLGKLALKNSEILLIPTKKGTGKTTQWIRDALIEYQKNGKPSYYVRNTIEQLEEFVQDDKFKAILDVLGFPITRDIIITRKGLFKYEYENKTKKKFKKPIIYFLSINEAMKIQSSKFLPGNYFILDEIQNHFMKSNGNIFNKFVNLVASVLREENTKIIILFNKVSNNDLFLQKFRVDKQIQQIKKGAVKTFERTLGRDEDGKLVKIKVSVFNPRQSKKLREAQKKSIANKLSYLAGDYGNVINSDDFYIDLADAKYINKLGDFEGIINFNGFKIGLWISKDLNFQFTSKYNITGKEYFLDIGEYSNSANLIKKDFLLKTKNKLLMREVEFEDSLIFQQVINMISQIDLYKN